MPEDERLPRSDPLRARAAASGSISDGEIEVVGRFTWGSNATFLAEVRAGDGDAAATRVVYKPERGERPLWDFPAGLWRREVAAYLISEHLGWGFVPETLRRDDGPLGVGSVQRYVDADDAETYFTLLDVPERIDELVRVAVFDLVINNADRKAGHVLLGDDGRLWVIDHGLCFHSQPKLRTVIWELGGMPIPISLRSDLQRLSQDVPAGLTELLDDEEVAMLTARAARVSELDALPDVAEDARPYPWPLV